MTKSELIEILVRKQSQLGYRDVELAVKTMLEQMGQTLASGRRIEIRGFGSFSLHYRPPGWDVTPSREIPSHCPPSTCPTSSRARNSVSASTRSTMPPSSVPARPQQAVMMTMTRMIDADSGRC